jgi:hypothetical protein
VAFLPLVRPPRAGDTECDVRCAPAATTDIERIEGLAAAMELLVILAFLVLLATGSVLGWTADSRDSADWKPSPVRRL